MNNSAVKQSFYDIAGHAVSDVLPWHVMAYVLVSTYLVPTDQRP